MYNSILKSLFLGYAEAKKPKRLKQQFDELERTPFLFSHDHLSGLYEEASEKEDYEAILDHLYKHDAIDVDSYASLESKIIDKYWRR
jgi:hypothetical protein